MLSHDDIEEYRLLCKTRLGWELTHDEARVSAERFMHIMRTLADCAPAVADSDD